MIGANDRQAFAGSAAPTSGIALPRDLARVLAWLRANLHEPVRLDDLARIAGTAPRTLEAHFRQFLGTTPLGWARRERLAQTRRALLAPSDGTRVTQVALQSGFTQLGRFAQDYRRQYGETPSQTLRRVRSGTTCEVDDEAVRLTWTALPACFAVAPRHCDAALEKLERAQRLAPGYGLPKSLAAWCWSQRASQHFGGTPDDLDRAVRMAREACSLSQSDPLSLAIASGAFTLAHRLDEADALLERALAQDPSSAIAWLRRGWSSAYSGEGDLAVRELRVALQLMPFDPIRPLAFIGIGFAHFTAERYPEAARWVRAGVDASQGCHWAERVVAASAMHAKAGAEARRVVRRLLHKDPTLTVEVAEKAWPLPPRVVEQLAEGLAAAGLPRH
jgi:AraC-like DNA-binding protein